MADERLARALRRCREALEDAGLVALDNLACFWCGWWTDHGEWRQEAGKPLYRGGPGPARCPWCQRRMLLLPHRRASEN